MEPAHPAPAGFIHTLRSLGESLLAGAHRRIELLGVELQEEKFRLIQTLIWITAAVFTAMLAVTFASLTLIYLLWESARLAAFIGLTLFYIGVLAAILIGLRRYLARQPKPFAATLQELAEDRECILPKS